MFFPPARFASALVLAFALSALGAVRAGGAPPGAEECALASLDASIAEQAHQPVLDGRWRWARLHPDVQSADSVDPGPTRRLPPLPLLDAATLLVEWAGLPVRRVLASPEAHLRVLQAPVLVSGSLPSRLDALAQALGSDVVLAYDVLDGTLHAHVPPLLVLRSPPGVSRLSSVAVLRGAGVTDLRVTAADGAVWASAPPDAIDRAALRLARLEAAPAAIVLDLRFLRLRPSTADATWLAVNGLAAEVRYDITGREVLTWPVLARRQAAFARDQLLSGASVHTVRRVLVVPEHLTALPFDPSLPCAAAARPPTPSLARTLALTVTDPSLGYADLSLSVLPPDMQGLLTAWVASTPAGVSLGPGSALAFRDGVDVAFAQLRPVGTARVSAQ